MKRSFYLSLPLLDFLHFSFTISFVSLLWELLVKTQKVRSDLPINLSLSLSLFNLSLSFPQQRYVAPSPIQVQQRETLEKAMALARDHAIKRSTMTNMAGQLSQRTAEKLSESSWKRTIAESLGKR